MIFGITKENTDHSAIFEFGFGFVRIGFHHDGDLAEGAETGFVLGTITKK